MKGILGSRFSAVILITMLVVVLLPAAAFAANGKDVKVADGQVMLQSDTGDSTKVDKGVAAQSTYTRTVQYKKDYYNLLGICVAKHYASTQWTYDGVNLYNSPKGYWNDWWTAPLYSCSNSTGKWDWYTAGYHGTGQSNQSVLFSSTIPTPWGSVTGSSLTSRIKTYVTYTGSHSAS